jgi:hypothetical protein
MRPIPTARNNVTVYLSNLHLLQASASVLQQYNAMPSILDGNFVPLSFLRALAGRVLKPWPGLRELFASRTLPI